MFWSFPITFLTWRGTILIKLQCSSLPSFLFRFTLFCCILLLYNFLKQKASKQQTLAILYVKSGTQSKISMLRLACTLNCYIRLQLYCFVFANFILFFFWFWNCMWCFFWAIAHTSHYMHVEVKNLWSNIDWSLRDQIA
jgi:hypothetical protein